MKNGKDGREQHDIRPADLQLLKSILASHQEQGYYWGNKKAHDKRLDRLMNWIDAEVEEAYKDEFP